MDLRTWITIVIILILLGVLFYLRTKRQGEEAKANVVEEKPMSMEENNMEGETSEEDRRE